MGDNYQLDKVIILSRHGIRTPLSNTIDFLNQVTPLQWPTWDYPFGYLTTRGGILEAYFGHYFSQWFKTHKILSATNTDALFVYANSLQRTVATAQFFITGAYAGHDVAINHKYPIEKMDAIFDPSLRDDSTEFKQHILNDFAGNTILEGLGPTYELLSEILDYKRSALFQKYQCELAAIPTQINLKINQEPSVSGPLAIGTAVADAFLLQYYSAFPANEIAWGKIKRAQQWQAIIHIRNQYINLLCHSKTLAKHIAFPLINMINNLLQNSSYKVSLLVGHDSNIAALLGALQFQNYVLPNQFEQTPIGGKVVLQRFYHHLLKRHFFKAEYVYQSFEQLHLGEYLHLNNPPMRMELKLENSATDSDGFYDWHEFETRIQMNLA